MKRRQLLKHLKKHKCVLKREGSKHSIYYNTQNHMTTTIPRHSELRDFLARKICQDLGIPHIK
jgi:mRNA interferase HicA